LWDAKLIQITLTRQRSDLTVKLGKLQCFEHNEKISRSVAIGWIALVGQ